MQLPLPLHTEAQRIASSLPAPPVIRSTIAAVVSVASASPIPAGSTIGQARKHSPQRVQASAIASPRARNSSRYPPAKLPSPIIAPDRYPDPPDFNPNRGEAEAHLLIEATIMATNGPLY